MFYHIPPEEMILIPSFLFDSQIVENIETMQELFFYSMLERELLKTTKKDDYLLELRRTILLVLVG